MLVLERRKDESAVIKTEDGEIISVMVLDIAQGRVKLGIEAPKSMRITREPR